MRWPAVHPNHCHAGWTQDGRAHFYITHGDQPKKIHLSRTPRGLWKLHFYWRRLGEMVLVDAPDAHDDSGPMLHSCHLTERHLTADASAGPPFPGEQLIISSLPWIPTAQSRSVDATCSAASAALVHDIVASLDMHDGPDFLLPHKPDLDCPATVALLDLSLIHI